MLGVLLLAFFHVNIELSSLILQSDMNIIHKYDGKTFSAFLKTAYYSSKS